MNLFDENTHLRTIATMLVAERDAIHPAHAENRVVAAMRLAEAVYSHGYLTDLDGTDWVEMSRIAGLTRPASDATIALAVSLLLLQTAKGAA
jgi:hypothetical protein